MLKGFWKLTWLETKIFVREPMGLIGTLGIPVLLFIVLGRIMRAQRPGTDVLDDSAPFNLAVLTALMIAINAVLSLVAIMSIYREGGILKRLRATPLSPLTILGSQVVVKLLFTIVTLLLLVAAGRRMFPGVSQVGLPSFAVALLLSSLSILSLGFLIASVVPTARFAQPVGAAILYPLMALSGLFYPVSQLPTALRWVVSLFPTTHAVTLMQGVWNGASWLSLSPSVAALGVIFVVCCAAATRVFRWE